MPTPHRDAWRFLTESDHDRAISCPRYTAVLTEPVPTECSTQSTRNALLRAPSCRDSTACSTPSIRPVVTAQATRASP
eukprot:1211353-Rhodomonas_salina.1